MVKRYRVLKLYTVLKSHLRLLTIVLSLSLAATILGVLPPLMSRSLVDQGIMRSDLSSIAFYSVVLIVIHAASTGVGALRGYYQSLLSGRVALDLRSRVFSKAIELGVELYQGGTQVGDVVTRLYGYVDRVQRFIVSSFETIFLSTLQLVAMMFIVFSLNWKLSLVLLIPLPFYVYGLVVYQPRVRTLFMKRWSRVSRMSAHVTSILSSVLLVKLTGRERAEMERFGSLAGDVLSAEIEASKFNLRVYPWLNLLLVSASVAVMYIGGMMVVEGELTIGTLTAFLAYVWQVYGPIQSISSLVPQLAEAEAAYEKLSELLEAEPRAVEAPNAKPIDIKGRIEVKDVKFEYSRGRQVLKGVSFTIEPGEVVGIVGPNGSGKTTLVRLLVRLFDPNDGQILLDGVSLREVKLSSLRGQVILIPQEPMLLPGSVAYNIAYGVSEPSPFSILFAAWLCGAHRFIVELPLAYDSDVGEQGRGLSGGQRQLICLARALILRPRVLILDEATSNVHVELEETIMRRLLAYLKDTTIIAISHRPTLNKFVSRVILMNEGRALGEAKGGLDERPHVPSLKEIRVVQDLRVIDRGAWLEADMNGHRVGELRVRLPFPLSYPRLALLYRDPDDMLVIENWMLLDPESRQALLRHLVKEHGLVYAKLLALTPTSRFVINAALETVEGRISIEVPTSNIFTVDGVLVLATATQTYIVDPATSSKEAVWKAKALAVEPLTPFRIHGLEALVRHLVKVHQT